MVELSREYVWHKHWLEAVTPQLRKFWRHIALFVVLILGVASQGMYLSALALLAWFLWSMMDLSELFRDPGPIEWDHAHGIILFTAKDSSPTSSQSPPASPRRPDPA
jgi:hypothetical protein